MSWSKEGSVLGKEEIKSSYGAAASLSAAVNPVMLLEEV